VQGSALPESIVAFTCTYLTGNVTKHVIASKATVGRS
jgi:hypothetical protein